MAGCQIWNRAIVYARRHNLRDSLDIGLDLQKIYELFQIIMLAIPPLAAEQIFSIGSFPVYNTYINSTIVLVLFLILGLVLRKRAAEIQDKVQNFAESILEVILGFMDQVTRDRRKSLRFLPVVGTLFLFILISNWIGLLP